MVCTKWTDAQKQAVNLWVLGKSVENLLQRVWHQQVIIIEPANPQVVYVPQYNPQVVYTQPAPVATSSDVVAAGLVGFAAGDIPAIKINLALVKGASIVGVFWGADFLG